MSIRDMPAHDRPREKLGERGPGALTNEELVAVIIGMGGAGHDVRTIARGIAECLDRVHGSVSVDDLRAIPGVGAAKSAQIVAAFELARRFLAGPTVRITSPSDVLPLIRGIAQKNQEHFVCMSLNGAHEVIETRIVTIGLLDRSQIHPREVFADVISDRAAAVIFAHNHPSGNLDPSEQDRLTHRQLTDAGKILGIRVLDHLIVSKRGYFSFQEGGLMEG